MTLRARLALGLSVVIAVFLIGAVGTVVTQRNFLLGQLDDQLRSTPPTPAPREGSPQPSPTNSQPISDLYMASINADGEARIIVQGQRLDDLPDVPADMLREFPKRPKLASVPGVNGESSFRVLFVPADSKLPSTVLALPLDNVDAAVRRLIYTFMTVAVVIAGVLALLTVWINRLGLRPLAEMTVTADAIAAGDRQERAGPYGESTEAGRLAAALNLMLDERDADETRLRQFVSNASHELRTPLTSIRGFLDLYEQGAFRGPGQLEDAVRRMQNESARMNLLVEDLLVLAKFDEEQPLRVSTVDISELIDDVAASARVGNEGRSIEVNRSSEPALLVEADGLRIHQVIAGLVNNAMIHTPASAEVSISARRSGEMVEVVVSDTGPGMNASDASQVFGRFYRGDHSRARSSGGSGLGLAIAKSIVEAHGGMIELTTELGSGSSFKIHLPVRQYRSAD